MGAGIWVLERLSEGTEAPQGSWALVLSPWGGLPWYPLVEGVVLILHHHYLVVAWAQGADEGCCIAIIWLLLNSRVQVGGCCPSLCGWGHPLVCCCGSLHYHYLVDAETQGTVIIALPLCGSVQTLYVSMGCLLPLGPRGLPGPRGSPGSSGRGSGPHSFWLLLLVPLLLLCHYCYYYWHYSSLDVRAVM